MADTEEELIGGEDLDYEEYDLDEEEENALLADHSTEQLLQEDYDNEELITQDKGGINQHDAGLINHQSDEHVVHEDEIIEDNEEDDDDNDRVYNDIEESRGNKDESPPSTNEERSGEIEEDDEDSNKGRGRDRFKSERLTISLNTSIGKSNAIPDSLDEVKIKEKKKKKSKNNKKGSVYSRLNGGPKAAMGRNMQPPGLCGPRGLRPPPPPWAMRMSPNGPMMRPMMRMMGPPMRMGQSMPPPGIRPQIAAPTQGHGPIPAQMQPPAPIMERLGPATQSIGQKQWSRASLPTGTKDILTKVIENMSKKQALPVKMLGPVQESVKRQAPSPPPANTKVMKTGNQPPPSMGKPVLQSRLSSTSGPPSLQQSEKISTISSNPNLRTIETVNTFDHTLEKPVPDSDYNNKIMEQKQLREQMLARKEARRKASVKVYDNKIMNQRPPMQQQQQQPPPHYNNNNNRGGPGPSQMGPPQWKPEPPPHHSGPPERSHFPPSSQFTQPPSVVSAPAPVFNSPPPQLPPPSRQYYPPAPAPTPAGLPNTNVPPPTLPPPSIPPSSINTQLPPPPFKYNAAVPPPAPAVVQAPPAPAVAAPAPSTYNSYQDPSATYASTWDKQPQSSYDDYSSSSYNYVGQEDYYQTSGTQYQDYESSQYTTSAQQYTTDDYYNSQPSYEQPPATAPVIRVLSSPRKIVKTSAVRYTSSAPQGTSLHSYENEDPNDWSSSSQAHQVPSQPAPTVTKKFFRRIIKRNKNGEVFSIRKVPVDAEGNEIGEAIIEFQQEPVKRTSERRVVATTAPAHSIDSMSRHSEVTRKVSPYHYTVQLLDLPTSLKEVEVKGIIHNTGAGTPLDIDYDHRTGECNVRFDTPDAAQRLYQKMNRKMLHMSVVKAKLLT